MQRCAAAACWACMACMATARLSGGAARMGSHSGSTVDKAPVFAWALRGLGFRVEEVAEEVDKAPVFAWALR
eukprot:152449-Chlamydomonas_euryale.AAC.1